MSEEAGNLSDAEVASNSIIVIICIVGAGLASGLTQGLLSLSPMDIEIKKRTGTDKEKKQAAALAPLISRHHLLLVTLLLMNATAMEMLPLALDKLVPEFVAIIISVTLILFCGEILPAALMTGPYQLDIVTFLSPFVYVTMMLFLPISYPLSRVLDVLLGHDEGVTTYNRMELRTMVRIQHEFMVKESVEQLRKSRASNVGSGTGVAGDIESGPQHQSSMKMEINMIDSVLKFRDAVVCDVMTEDVFMLSMDDRFSFETLNLIFKSGYSRFPVYEKDRNDVVGLLLAKDLLFLDPEDELPVRSVMSLFCRPIQSVWPDDKLHEVLARFKQHRSHMGIVKDVYDDGVRDPYYRVIGIITLEDIFEKVLGEDIMDETDVLDENNLVVKDKRREVDLSKIRLLNPSMFEKSQRLSEEEINAITAHLETNVPSIAQVYKHNSNAIRRVVSSAMVFEEDAITIESNSIENALSASATDITSGLKYLYERGIVANFCVLILSGKVTVLAGKDNFKAELGPWSAIGQDSLIDPSGCFVPDFSAYVSSGHVKYLKICSQIHTEAEHNAPVLNKRRATFKEVLAVSEFDRTHSPAIDTANGDSTSPEPHQDQHQHNRVPGLVRKQSMSIRRKQSLRGDTRDLEEAMEAVNSVAVSNAHMNATTSSTKSVVSESEESKTPASTSDVEIQSKNAVRFEESS